MAKKFSYPARYEAAHKHMEAMCPHVYGLFSGSEDFVSLLVKAKDDGTYLAVLKKYAADGGPVVLFGSGYDVPGALMGLDLAAQGGAWKVDKPWSGKGS